MKSVVAELLEWAKAKKDVVDMLMDLREINPESVPINFLLPIPGTRLADRDISELTPEYCLKGALSCKTDDFKIRLFDVQRDVKFISKELSRLLFKVVDSIFASGYLTAGGQGIDADNENDRRSRIYRRNWNRQMKNNRES